MFGYINPIKAELDSEQRKEYQLFYCTLCQTLGNNYGRSARMALSYDATLLSIMIVGMLESQGINQPAAGSARCPAALWRKKDCLDSDHPAFAFAASAGLEAVAGKILDNIQDEGRFYNRLLWKWMQPRHIKAEKEIHLHGLELDMEAMASQQFKAEKESVSLIEVAQQTSAALGQVFAAVARLGGKEESANNMYELGYYTGRVIYILDACDDLPRDQKQCAYNAISACYENACYQEKGQALSLDSRVKEDVATLVVQDLARIRSLIDGLDFGSRQHLVRRLLVTSLSNQAMLLFGYLQVEKHSPWFSPWRVVFDESGVVSECLGAACVCLCVAGCLQICYEQCVKCCCDNDDSRENYQYHPVEQQRPSSSSGADFTQSPPRYCSRCGSRADVVYHPQKGWVCLSCADDYPDVRIETRAVSGPTDAVGKVCPYCQTPIKPGEHLMVCPRCKVPHHRECWQENGDRCTTFGCR